MTAALSTGPVALDGWVHGIAALGGAVESVDLSGTLRPAAVRSRLRQAMTRLTTDLYFRPSVRGALVLVWTGAMPASPRARSLALAAAEAAHRRSEMVRGIPLGLAVVFVDDGTPREPLARRLRQGVAVVPDGVAALRWADVCAHGVREAVAATRV